MWDETVEIPLRVEAAAKLHAWIERGDFREPDLSIHISEQTLQ
jgi:hypothetical protein